MNRERTWRSRKGQKFEHKCQIYRHRKWRSAKRGAFHGTYGGGPRRKWSEFRRLISYNLDNSLGEPEWRNKPRVGNPNNDDCSCIVDTGVNGGALRSFNWAHRYIKHIRVRFTRKCQSVESSRDRLKFFCGESAIGRFKAWCSFTYFRWKAISQLRYDRSAGALNYCYESILQGRWISRLISVIEASTLGRANEMWWLVIRRTDVYFLLPQLRSVIKIWKNIPRKWQLRVRSFGDASRFCWNFGS